MAPSYLHIYSRSAFPGCASSVRRYWQVRSTRRFTSSSIHPPLHVCSAAA